MPKVSVITVTYRDPERLLLQAGWLAEQTLQDFEWIVVDDKHGSRPDLFKHLNFPIIHIPPRIVRNYMAPCAAMNDGIRVARGDLLYFMADTVRITEDVLQIHWDAFERFGPDVIMSGAMLGGPGHGMTEDRNSPHDIGGGAVEVLDHAYTRRWYWGGRNDSAGRAATLRINGFYEGLDGQYGGADVVFAAMMITAAGCRYLILRSAVCYDEFSHAGKKPPSAETAQDWDYVYRAAMRGQLKRCSTEPPLDA